MRSVVRLLPVLLASAVLATACSSGDDTAGTSTDPAATPAPTVATTATAATEPPDTDAPTTDPPDTDAPATDPPATEPQDTEAPATEPPTTEAPDTGIRAAFDPSTVGEVDVDGPITTGKGTATLTSGTDLAAAGYVEEEYFLSGTAHAYAPVGPLDLAGPLPADGRWSVTPTDPTPYTTRVVVRRPADPARANGKVIVEWLNVSAGFDSGPDWIYLHTALTRDGWTWVGVSAQQLGVEGGRTAIVPGLVLKEADPVRYAPLSHPGDSWSYDIYSQAGAAVRTQWETLLGGMEPERIVAIGESQSAIRMTTYVNAVAPMANVFDGYLVHSRAGAGANLSQPPLAEVPVPNPTLIRTDLTVPVLTVVAETDVSSDGLNAVSARQPDTDMIRLWEMAGTSHADTYTLGISATDVGDGAADAALFDTMLQTVDGVYGGIISCDSAINAGPHTYVLRSALSALDTWMSTGTPPAEMPRLETDASGSIVRDEHGTGVGGIRTPHVDVPIATLSGGGQSGGGFCFLFGTTVPFDEATLARLYADRSSYVSAWTASLDEAVTNGAILPVDADVLAQVVADADVPLP